MHSFPKFAFAKALSRQPVLCLLLLIAVPVALRSQARIVNATIDVQVEDQTLGALPATITVRPFSVSIYSYPVQ